MECSSLRFQPCGIWWCVVGWVVPDLSVDYGVLVFSAKKPNKPAWWPPQMKALWSFEMLGTSCAVTQCHIPDDWNLHVIRYLLSQHHAPVYGSAIGRRISAVVSGEYRWLSCVYFCVLDIANIVDIHKFFHQFPVLWESVRSSCSYSWTS
jgi:hypothetical protein